MNYFKLFPTVGYDVNRTGTQQDVVDIYRQVRPIGDRLDQLYSYTTYTVQDGERPDIVSQILYGTPKYYWTLKGSLTSRVFFSSVLACFPGI